VGTVGSGGRRPIDDVSDRSDITVWLQVGYILGCGEGYLALVGQAVRGGARHAY